MKKVLLLIGISALSLVFWSCENEEEANAPQVESKTELSQAEWGVLQSQLIAVRNAIGQRVLAHPERWNDLEQAFQERDESAIQSLLEISDEEEAAYRLILEEIRTRISSGGIELSSVPQDCDSDCLPNMFAALKEDPAPFALLFGARGNRAPDGCDYEQYVLALAGCAGLGPYLYWPCAYVAYCEFCYGPTHDEVCEPLEQLPDWH
ncbi:hypothetical protein HZ996_00980 [Cryomorphaceae bacterium]|nr:hypothetical protein HZ996_00980 [Cryomorphaceae bacterium]